MTRLALALTLLGSACSTTMTVKRPLGIDTLAETNETLQGQTATVVHEAKANGDRQSDIASEISLTPQTARWTVWDSGFARDRGTPPGQPVQAPIDSLRRITLCDASCRRIGALEGAGLGFVAGLVLGVIIAKNCGPDSPCAYALIEMPLLVALPGTLLGVSFGHRTNIEFEPAAKR